MRRKIIDVLLKVRSARESSALADLGADMGGGPQAGGSDLQSCTPADVWS